MEFSTPAQFEQMCRVCMSCDKEMLHSIFDYADHQNSRIQIHELLSKTVQNLPKIEIMDALPKNLCTSCLEKLCDFNKFQNFCINTDLHLRKLIGIKNNSMDPLQTDATEIENFIKPEIETGAELFENTIKDSNPSANNKDDDKKESVATTDTEADEKEESSIKNENFPKISIWTCKRCQKKFMCKKSLKRHIKRIHNEVATNDELKAGYQKISHVALYKCNDCKRMFQKKAFLRKHKCSCKQPCDVCGIVFKNSKSLRQHYMSVHPERIKVEKKEQPYLCAHCGKTFSKKSYLQQHALRHEIEKRYECTECPKKFFNLSDLSSHMQVHKQLKPHICDICNAAFGKPFQLKKHKMYHNGEKRYQCEDCPMRFVCADLLRRHMRKHTGEKPYKCKYCQRSYSQSCDMIKHLRIHLGENVYQCELCPAAFRFATELRTHFALHKNDDEETKQRNKLAWHEAQAQLKRKLESERSTNSSTKAAFLTNSSTLPQGGHFLLSQD